MQHIKDTQIKGNAFYVLLFSRYMTINLSGSGFIPVVARRSDYFAIVWNDAFSVKLRVKAKWRFNGIQRMLRFIDTCFNGSMLTISPLDLEWGLKALWICLNVFCQHFVIVFMECCFTENFTNFREFYGYSILVLLSVFFLCFENGKNSQIYKMWWLKSEMDVWISLLNWYSMSWYLNRKVFMHEPTLPLKTF